MSKWYNIKVYDVVGNFITTINKPLSGFSFSNSINSGVDNVTVNTEEPTESTTYDDASYIEITEYSESNKSGTSLFAGYVQSNPWQLTESQDTIGLECVGLHYLLSDIIYVDGASLTFNKSNTLENILTDIISVFNAEKQRNPPASYNGFIWSELIKLWTMPSVSIDIDFDKDNCLQSVIKCFEGAGLDFYIEPDGTIQAKEKPSEADHRLTLHKDIQTMTIKKEDKEDLINSIRVERSWGVVKLYEDATSISNYDKKQIYISETDIGNETTQDQFASKYLEDNKNPKREISIVVNNRYPIASIQPGDYIKVLNTTLSINNLKILKTSYNGNLMTLNIDKYVSLWQLLK